MKHLIETIDSSSLPIVEYDRLILNSTTNDVLVRGGVNTEYVDLGLSVKWAKCNIGAETETDYGDFFMWGSTKANTPDECVWEHAPFNGGNTSYNADAFNKVKDTACPNGILAKEYDAAAQIMGGDWRMPTEAEIQELIKNTTSEWTQVGDVYGRRFTSKKEGYQNNSIFIPAAGYCYDGSVSHVGSTGYVWSSSLNTSSPDYAWYLYFYSGNCSMSSYNRYYGQSVRGVRN